MYIWGNLDCRVEVVNNQSEMKRTTRFFLIGIVLYFAWQG